MVRGAKVSARESLVRRDDHHADARREHPVAAGAERCGNDLGIDGILAEANRRWIAHAARGRGDGVRRLRRRVRQALAPGSPSGFGVTSSWYGMSGSGGASAAGAGMLCSAAGGGASKSGFDLSLVNSNAALIMSSNAATTMSSDILCCPGSAVTRLVSSAAAGCRRAASRCAARAAAACAARLAAATRSSVESNGTSRMKVAPRRGGSEACGAG